MFFRIYLGHHKKSSDRQAPPEYLTMAEYRERLKKEHEMLGLAKGDEPFALVKDIVTEADRQKIREFFHAKKAEHMAGHIVGGSDYDVAVIDQRMELPEIEAKLEKLFPTMMVYRTVYLSGCVENGQYSGWHTDYNGTKSFHGRPVAWNLWIPLQDLNKDTGGQLIFYNGSSQAEIEEVLRLVRKKNMLFQYVMLDLLKEQLNEHTVTTDIKFGDGLVFSEITPHKVGTDFKPSGDTTAREVLTLWLIEKDSKLDNDFIEDVIAFPEDGVINQIETKEHITALERFCTQTRSLFLTSQEMIAKRQEQQDPS